MPTWLAVQAERAVSRAMAAAAACRWRCTPAGAATRSGCAPRSATRPGRSRRCCAPRSRRPWPRRPRPCVSANAPRRRCAAGLGRLPRRRLIRRSMKLLVTRPAAQAVEWWRPCAALRHRGRCAAADRHLRPARRLGAGARGLGELAAHRLVMFVSPNAAEQFFALRPPAWPGPRRRWPARPARHQPARCVRWRARGLHRRAGRRRGAVRFRVAVAAAEIAPLARRPVLIVRGESGRDWLADTLRAQGASVQFRDRLRARRAAPVRCARPGCCARRRPNSAAGAGVDVQQLRVHRPARGPRARRRLARRDRRSPPSAHRAARARGRLRPRARMPPSLDAVVACRYNRSRERQPPAPARDHPGAAGPAGRRRRAAGGGRRAAGGQRARRLRWPGAPTSASARSSRSWCAASRTAPNRPSRRRCWPTGQRGGAPPPKVALLEARRRGGAAAHPARRPDPVARARATRTCWSTSRPILRGDPAGRHHRQHRAAGAGAAPGDERLARYSQPRLEGVRRAIARDLDRVKSAGALDIASLTIKLDETMRMVDELPLLATAEPRREPRVRRLRPQARSLGGIGSIHARGCGRRPVAGRLERHLEPPHRLGVERGALAGARHAHRTSRCDAARARAGLLRAREPQTAAAQRAPGAAEPPVPDRAGRSAIGAAGARALLRPRLAAHHGRARAAAAGEPAGAPDHAAAPDDTLAALAAAAAGR